MGRVERVLRVRAAWAEDDAPGEEGGRVRPAIEDLGGWLGARGVAIGRDVPRA